MQFHDFGILYNVASPRSPAHIGEEIVDNEVAWESVRRERWKER